MGSSFGNQVRNLGEDYVEKARDLLKAQDGATIANLKQVFGYDNIASTPAGQAIIKSLQQ